MGGPTGGTASQVQAQEHERTLERKAGDNNTLPDGEGWLRKRADQGVHTSSDTSALHRICASIMEDRIMNLVDLVKDQLGSNVLTRLAETLGTSRDNTSTAVNAAVPTLLTALGSVASTRDGARDLAAAVGSVDDRVLDNLPQSLSGGGRSGLNLVDMGTKLLGSLLGGNTLSSLASTLGRSTGMSSGSMSSLLTLLAPVVLGVLKNRTGGGADASALASLFEGQRQNIVNALPSGLSGQLASVPGMSEAASWVRGTAGAAHQAGRAAVSEAGRVARGAAATGSSALRWGLPLLAVLIVGGLLWWWGTRSTPQQAVPVTPPAISTDQVTRLTGQVTDFFRTATDTFTGVKDAASAEVAAPKLRELSTRLDTMRVAMNQLPADARAKLVALVKDLGAKLTPAIEATMAIPTVGDTLKPYVDDLRSKLNALSTA